MFQQEIQTQVNECLTAIKAAQDKLDANDGRVDGEIKSIQEKMETALQKAQELEAQQKAQDEYNTKIERMLCNMDKGYIDIKNEMEEKARDAFARYLRKRVPIQDEKVIEYIVNDIVEKSNIGIDDKKKQNLKMELKDLQVQVDPDGGYFVRPEISDKMITRVFESSPVRQYATVTNINSDALEMLIDDNEGETGGWVGETEDRPDTNTPQIGKKTIYAHEQFAQPRATQKMLDDAGFDIEAWLMGKITRKFTRVENNAFVVGDGVKKPRGFLTYPAWTTPGTYERGKIEQRTSNVIGSFDSDDFKKLQSDLLEDYQPGAVWMMKRKTFTEVALLKDGEDRYLLDLNSFKTGDTLVLLGKPVVFMHDMPDLANDSLSIAYGDLSVAYTVVDRIGIRIVRDIYTGKPFTKFYTTKRVGGDVTSYDALKILKTKAS
jgi:HK97 family phage major capsid protein